MSVTNAKAQLTDLVRRAEAGDDVVLTRHGRPVVRLTPVAPSTGAEARRALIESVRASALSKATGGEGAARSQDDLYDGNGLPG